MHPVHIPIAYLRCILILSSHLRLRLPSFLLPSTSSGTHAQPVYGTLGNMSQVSRPFFVQLLAYETHVGHFSGTSRYSCSCDGAPRFEDKHDSGRKLHAFLTSLLDADECQLHASASLTPGLTQHDIHSRGGMVGPRTSLGQTRRGKSHPSRHSNHPRRESLHRLSYPVAF